MRKELKSFCGAVGTIDVKRDGSARLVIRAGGKKVHDKIHKSEKAAMACWYRFDA